MKIVVTGAFSYTGKYITRRLLDKGEEVITLTNHPDRPDPFARQGQSVSAGFQPGEQPGQPPGRGRRAGQHLLGPLRPGNGHPGGRGGKHPHFGPGGTGRRRAPHCPYQYHQPFV